MQFNQIICTCAHVKHRPAPGKLFSAIFPCDIFLFLAIYIYNRICMQFNQSVHTSRIAHQVCRPLISTLLVLQEVQYNCTIAGAHNQITILAL